MLYGDMASGLIENPLHDKNLKMLERRLDSVTLDGQQLSFHHPHTQPYTYLGVENTMTLNWEQQRKNVTTSKPSVRECSARSHPLHQPLNISKTPYDRM
jgi:hypothetical protein